MADDASFPRVAARTIGVLVVLVAGYTLWRGAMVGLEYFDGYQYLYGARRMSGDAAIGGFSLARPPLLALANVPALALARLGAPANVFYRIGPHLTAALISLLSALAVFYAFSAAMNERLSLLGTAFLVTGRFFIRYGALTMADLASMGWAALALGLHLRTLERSTWRRDVLVGVALGLGALTKYPLIAMAAALVLAELLTALMRRRLPLRRIAGLAVSGLVTAVVFVAALSLIHGLGNGWQMKMLPRAIEEAVKTLAGNTQPLPGENRWDNAVLIAATVAWPLLALAAVGLLAVLRDRRVRDLPFLAWLFGFGFIFIATVAHNEARYLLPLVPPLLFLSVRGVEALLARLPARAAGPLLVALALACSWGGLRQAWADGDPIFRADTYRHAAVALVHARRPGGHLRWQGGFSCLYPVRRESLPRDEFFDAFHFYGPSMTILIGEAAVPTPSLLAAQDGDAILIPSPNCNGPLPATPPRPWVVQGVRRWRLFLEDGRYRPRDPALPVSLSLDSQPEGLVLRVEEAPPPAPGVERLLVVSDPAARIVGPLRASGRVPLGSHDASDLGLEVLELTTTTIPVR